MVVEFCGRAGIRKSYLAERLAERLTAKGYSCLYVSQHCGRGWKALNFKGVVGGIWLAYQLRGLNKRAIKMFTMALSRLYSWKQTPQIIIADENLFQSVQTLRSRHLIRTQSDPIASCLAHLSTFALPDVAIMVTASPEAIAARRKLYRGAGTLDLTKEVRMRMELEHLLARVKVTSNRQRPDRFVYTVVEYEQEAMANQIVDELVASISQQFALQLQTESH